MNYNLLSSTIYGAIITIISFGIIALFIFFGVKRGFTKTFIKDFGALFSLIFALLLCSTVVNFLERTYSSVKSFSISISGLMDNIFGKEVMDLHAGNVNSTYLQGILSSWLINTIINLIGANNNIENVPLREVVSPVFSYYIISFIVIVVLFILFRIIFYIIGKEFEKAYKIKIIKRLDKILGSVLGCIKGFVVLSLIITIINILPFAFTQSLALEISNNPVTSFISSINIIQLAISSTFSLVNIGNYL